MNHVLFFQVFPVGSNACLKRWFGLSSPFNHIELCLKLDRPPWLASFYFGCFLASWNTRAPGSWRNGRRLPPNTWSIHRHTRMFDQQILHRARFQNFGGKPARLKTWRWSNIPTLFQLDLGFQLRNLLFLLSCKNINIWTQWKLLVQTMKYDATVVQQIVSFI